MRINARLDDERAEKLRFIRSATSDSITGVVERAIDLYYEQVRATGTVAGDALRKFGFIGGFEADEELSVNYKQALAEGLGTKHGDR